MSTASLHQPYLSERQRWLAARRLASGDPLILAAASAGVNAHALRLVFSEDPDFAALVEAFRAIKALSRKEKRARLEDLCWDAAERAVLDGRVSTLNLCLKTLKLIDSPEAAGEDEDEALQAVLDSMSDEEYADYVSLGDDEELAAMRGPIGRETATLEPAVESRGDDAVEETPAHPAPTAPSQARSAPTPLFPLPTATAACAYGPAEIELPGKAQEKPAVAAAGWPAVEPAVMRAVVPWQKPAGSGFPRRPP